MEDTHEPGLGGNCKQQTHHPYSVPLTTHIPPLQVAHIGTWQDGSFGGDALDDNLIVEGWDRCVWRAACGVRRAACLRFVQTPTRRARSATFDDKSWGSVYNHDAYMSSRAVSADIMEPSHASSQVPAKSLKKRLFDTVIEMSEVYAHVSP